MTDNTDADEIDVLGEWPGSHYAVRHRNVIIVSWYGHADVEAARNFGTLAALTLSRSRASMVSSVHYIGRKVQLPDADTRAALLKVGENFRDRTACVAAIIVGDGFRASAMRGVVTGLRVLAPRTFDMRAFGTTSEALAWLPAEHAKRSGIEIQPQALSLCIERAGKRAEE